MLLLRRQRYRGIPLTFFPLKSLQLGSSGMCLYKFSFTKKSAEGKQSCNDRKLEVTVLFRKIVMLYNSLGHHRNGNQSIAKYEGSKSYKDGNCDEDGFVYYLHCYYLNLNT